MGHHSPSIFVQLQDKTVMDDFINKVLSVFFPGMVASILHRAVCLACVYGVMMATNESLIPFLVKMNFYLMKPIELPPPGPPYRNLQTS